MWKCIFVSCRAVWEIDRFYLLYEIAYNLIKQFFNVFYGVYFLRTLLAYIETEGELSAILPLLVFMLLVNVIFYVTDVGIMTLHFILFISKIKIIIQWLLSCEVFSFMYENPQSCIFSGFH